MPAVMRKRAVTSLPWPQPDGAARPGVHYSGDAGRNLHLHGPTALTITASAAPLCTIGAPREALADTLQQRCQRHQFIRGQSGKGCTKLGPVGLNRFFNDRIALARQARKKVPAIVAG